ncbi:MAG: signal peptidase II [Roseburia sp.]
MCVSKPDMLKKGVIGLVLSILMIILDQVTKAAAIAHLKGQDAIVLWKGVFELRYLENHGAAFGVLQGRHGLLIVFTVVVLFLITYLYLWRIPGERRFIWLNLAAVLFFAGAIGNFIDRIRYNYVVDFFYFCLIDFPIFNVADIYVTAAALLMIILGIFYYKEEDYDRIFSSKKKDHNKA